ncbi:MAG: hypothetical protein VKO01_12550 [Cyanobacteriota bacterium]|nr:hypothetical protein [Cyanobacteriota bacterium]
MYHCPKEGKINLEERQIAPGLSAHACPSCAGLWVPGANYLPWQAQRVEGDAPVQVAVLPLSLSTPFPTSPLDNRAALCPECHGYLARGRLTLGGGCFYIERCPSCQGTWCDGGEWQILENLQLDTHIEYIFSPEWQALVRQLETGERERQALVDKLGAEVAQRVLELGELLQAHPHGDFGVAYLMRRCDH